MAFLTFMYACVCERNYLMFHSIRMSMLEELQLLVDHIKYYYKIRHISY